MSLATALLIAAGVRAAPPLIKAETPLAERLRVLSPIFDPPPGQPLRVSERNIAIRRGSDQMLIKGELWIKPPKDQCIHVRFDLTRPDRKICKPTLWTWEIFDLDSVGRYSLTVVAGPNDQGTPLSWPTPYRSANYVPFDAPDTDTHFDVPLKSCTASLEDGDRKIVLELFDGRRWLIYLPPYDTPLIPNQEPPPKLIVRIDSKKEEPSPTSTSTPQPAAPAEKEVSPDDAAKAAGEGAETPETPKKRSSILSQLLSGEYKNVKEESYPFRLPKRNAYQMSSSHFMETSVPQGMNGVCRYSFSGAPGDPSSGAIECYDTDAFKSVFAFVSCFSTFEPRLNPKLLPRKDQTKGSSE